MTARSGCVQQAVREEEAARERERELQAAQRERERPFRCVARCITARGYAMTRPQFGFQKNKGAFLPWLEGAAADSEAVPPCGALHFPVMLFYPEASPYHDTIEDVCEADTIGDHLDAVRAPPVLPALRKIYQGTGHCVAEHHRRATPPAAVC